MDIYLPASPQSTQNRTEQTYSEMYTGTGLHLVMLSEERTVRISYNIAHMLRAQLIY